MKQFIFSICSQDAGGVARFMKTLLRSNALQMIAAVCRGSPDEMGYMQGAALKEKIAHAHEHLLTGLDAFRLQQPRWMPFGVYRRLAEWRASRFLSNPLKRHNPEMFHRLEGIARGAGMSVSSILLFNVLEQLLSVVGDCTACPGGCSAVAVRGSRSVTGEPIIARNFDYLPLVQPYYIVRDSRPQKGMRALEFTTAPLAGAVDGVNEAGLAITYDYAFTLDQPKEGAASISMLIAEALERCRTVSEAAAWINSRPKWGGGMLMLADPSGDIASLELSSTRSHLRRPAANEDILFHTNTFFDDRMKEVEVARNAVYTDQAPVALRGQRVLESPERRDSRFLQLLADAGPFDEDDLASIMADHGESGVPSEYTPCVHSQYWHTTACLQFMPKSRRMRVAYDSACRAKYEELQMS